MKRPIITILTAILLTSIQAFSAGLPTIRLQTAPNDSRAKEVLTSSIEAMGGIERLNAIESLAFVMSGDLFARNQSLRPDTPYDKFPASTTVWVDWKNDRLLWEQRTQFPGGIRFANRIALQRDGGFNLDLLMKNYTRLPANAPVRMAVTRMVPILFLKRVLDANSPLTYLGEAPLHNRPHQVVKFTLLNTEYKLFLDAETKLPSKYEVSVPDAWAGVDVNEVYYADFRPINGLLLPHRSTNVRSGRVVRDSSLSRYETNQPMDDNAFRLPDIPAAQSLSPAVKPLAKDVYLVEGLSGGGYRAMFVAFKDYVLVVEAPGNSQISTFVINQIKQTLPNKPIKYLVLTHYHDDHTGGLRPYIVEGAQIVTTKRNQHFFEQIAQAKYALAPDALAKQPQAPNFLLVDKHQRISDGEQTVEIYNIGPTPHAADMFIIYLPNEKLLFQGDLYNVPIGPVNQTTEYLIRQIEKLKLNVETVAGVHNNVTPFSQVKAESANRKSKDKGQ